MPASSGHITPSDPFLITGTILKDTITVCDVQATAYRLRLALPRVPGCYDEPSPKGRARQERTIEPSPPYMRIRRSLPIVLVVLLVAAALALVVVLRKHAPPEPARLLPTADGFFYVDLKWTRRANLAGELPPVSHDPDYEQFIQATGFQFERDLEEAAVAVHYPPEGGWLTTDPSPEPRYSEVFVGKIEGERLRAYLRKLSTAVDSYRSVDIFSIPHEGRTVRVAILGVDTVAVSNHPDPQVIQGIVERSRKLASPFGGPAFLRQYYHHIPIASLAWGIFKVGPSASSNVSPSPSKDWAVLFSKPAVVVASVRYLRALHFRAAAFTDSTAEAQRIATQVEAFLNLFHAAEGAEGASGPDADVKAVFDSLKVEQQGDRAVLTAIVPLGFIRKAVAEGPAAALSPPAPAPPPEPKSAAASKKRHKIVKPK